MHPSLYISEKLRRGCRTVERFLADVSSGHAEQLWASIIELADADAMRESLVPSSMFEGRERTQAEWNNADWTICHAVQGRMKRAGLAGCVTGDRRYAAGVPCPLPINDTEYVLPPFLRVNPSHNLCSCI